MCSRGLSMLIGIQPEDAFALACHQMENVAEKGGVIAAVKDLEAHYKRDLSEDERKIVAQAMTLGMCMSYLILGQNLAAVEADMRAHGIDPLDIARRAREGAEDAALKSTPQQEVEAERETNSLLKRVGGKPTLH